MTNFAKITCFSIILTMAGSNFAIAKGHDQGVADGTRTDASQFIRELDGSGYSTVVSQGRRGVTASRLKGGNRVEPVVNGRGGVVKN